MKHSTVLCDGNCNVFFIFMGFNFNSNDCVYEMTNNRLHGRINDVFLKKKYLFHVMPSTQQSFLYWK